MFLLVLLLFRRNALSQEVMKSLTYNYNLQGFFFIIVNYIDLFPKSAKSVTSRLLQECEWVLMHLLHVSPRLYILCQSNWEFVTGSDSGQLPAGLVMFQRCCFYFFSTAEALWTGPSQMSTGVCLYSNENFTFPGWFYEAPVHFNQKPQLRQLQESLTVCLDVCTRCPESHEPAVA